MCTSKYRSALARASESRTKIPAAALCVFDKGFDDDDAAAAAVVAPVAARLYPDRLPSPIGDRGEMLDAKN